VNVDCNDNNAAIHPNAPEICNGVDDNCVNGIDEGCSLSVYWKNNAGSTITEAKMNDNVNLVANSASAAIAINQNIRFEIKPKEAGSGCGTETLQPPSTLQSGTATATWTAKYCKSPYIFTASYAAFTSISSTSSQLTVKPAAKILSPTTGNAYAMGTDIPFTALLNTNGGSLTYKWNFDDGTTESKTGTETISHKYWITKIDERGQIVPVKTGKTVTVTLTVSDGTYSDTNSITLYITAPNEPCTDKNMLLGDCGQNNPNAGVSPITWCNPFTRKTELNCSACNYCPDPQKQFCNNVAGSNKYGDCVTPDCNGKDKAAECLSSPGCYFNATEKCLSCIDLLNDASQNALGCSAYSSLDECKADKCGLGLIFGGFCEWQQGSCILSSDSPVKTTECSGVKCSQTVSCANEKYTVDCIPEGKCCTDCQARKMSLEAVPCGKAGVEAVMPFFSSLQFWIAACAIAAFYALYALRRQRK
jgi:hypothetical protein